MVRVDPQVSGALNPSLGVLGCGRAIKDVIGREGWEETRGEGGGLWVCLTLAVVANVVDWGSNLFILYLFILISFQCR